MSETLLDETPSEPTGEATETAQQETSAEPVDAEAGPSEEPLGSGVNGDEGLFFGKYKTMEEAEKGFKNMQQKLREKSPEVPDEYSVDLKSDESFVEEFGEDMVDMFNPNEDPRFEVMKDVFKEAGLTQSQVDAIVKAQIRFDASNMPDLEAEAKALGDDREVILAGANRFVQKNFNAEEQQIAEQLGQSAAGVKFLYKLSQMSGEKPIPAEVNKVDAGPTSAELYSQAFAYRDEVVNFDSNVGAQKRYDQMLNAAVVREQKEKSGR